MKKTLVLLSLAATAVVLTSAAEARHHRGHHCFINGNGEKVCVKDGHHYYRYGPYYRYAYYNPYYYGPYSYHRYYGGGGFVGHVASNVGAGIADVGRGVGAAISDIL